MKTVWLVSLVLMVAGISCDLFADATFDVKRNSIQIWGFPEEQPCTPAKLFEIDKQKGWGKVLYDKNTDTYRVDCALWIGDNNLTNTYFQLGDADHPSETLIVKGDVFIHPYWVKGENPGENKWQGWPRKNKFVNRLTIGSEHNASIKPVLKIDNDKQRGYTLIVGGGQQLFAHGGQLHVYNGTITALTTSWQTAIGAGKKPNTFGLFGSSDSVILVKANLSWFKKQATYGLSPSCNPIVKNTTFDHMGQAFGYGNSLRYLKNCAFTNCIIAIDSYDINLILDNCVFRKNKKNWRIVGGKKLALIDCEIDTPEQGTVQQKHGQTDPEVSSSRHIIVKVVDKQGSPVSGAEVMITQEGSSTSSSIIVVQTGKNGMTPGIGSGDAILLKEWSQKASSENPSLQKYRYTINADVEWLDSARVTGFIPQKSWEIVTIILP